MEDPFVMDALEYELGKNAAAKAMVEAMRPEEREKFLRRVAGARSPEELTDAVNSLVGVQRGHPPYQL